MLATNEKRITSIIAALALGLLAGCASIQGNSDDEPDVGVDADASADVETPDTGTDEGDADVPDDDTSDAADVPFRPDVTFDIPPRPPEAKPLAVLIGINPTRAYYRQATTVQLTALVVGEDGTPLEADLVWRTFGPAQITRVPQQWFLAGAGDIRFEACIVNSALCGERTITVDSGPPFLSLTWPPPGAEFSASEAPMIRVEGTVADERPVAVTVNGQRTPVDEEGRFRTEIEPRFGINHIDVTASDGVYPNAARAAVDVMWAPEYRPTAVDWENPMVDNSFANALQLRVQQHLLDDGIPYEPMPGETVIETRDLASIIELVLNSLDVSTALPDPLIDTGGFFMRMSDFDIGTPLVQVDFTDRGIQVFVQFVDAFVATEGIFTIGEATPVELDLTGEVVATMSANIEFAIGKESAEAPLILELDAMHVGLTTARSDFVSDEANALFELAEGLLFPVVEAALIAMVEPMIAEAIPPLVESVFDTMEDLLGGQELELDLGFGDPIMLTLEAPISSITTRWRETMRASIDVRLATDRERLFPRSRGVAVAPTGVDPVFTSAPLALVIDMEFLNGLLHTVWDSGLLNLDVTDMLPPALSFVVDSIQLDGWLPPFVTVPDRDLGDFNAMVTLGQTHLILGRGEQRDVVGMNLSAGIKFGAIDGAITIEVEESPQVTMWLIQSTGPTPIFADTGALEALVTGLVWGELTEALDGALSFELPTLDASALAELAPAMEDFTLSVVMHNDPIIRDGAFVITIGIVGELRTGE